MKITVIGTGYVGLVTGACFANVGHEVVCLDIDDEKIARLNRGEIPIYEPGLEPIVQKNRDAGRLTFTTDTGAAVSHGLLQIIAVGTPPGEDGSADLQFVVAVASEIGSRMAEYKLIVTKSTVPVGTADRVRKVIDRELQQRQCALEFDVVSNPEFLKEGQAVEDFLRPDRIIIGSETSRAIRLMREVYAPLNRNHDRLMVMTTRSAELTKYAANAMLATRISFMNELAILAEHIGADIEEIRQGIGSDSRIGFDFLYAGCGYGGSCFPKDVRALCYTASQRMNSSMGILEAVAKVNERQKRVLFEKISRYFQGQLEGVRIAVWGLSFKPNTDDMREATSLVLIEALARAGVRIAVFDPVAMDEARKQLAHLDCVEYFDRPSDALMDADALVIVTEWPEFRAPDFDRMKACLRHPVVFDGRNLFDPQHMSELGFYYEGIGRLQADRKNAAA